MKLGRNNNREFNDLQPANNIEKINRSSFNIMTLIGTGGFSKVWYDICYERNVQS